MNDPKAGGGPSASGGAGPRDAEAPRRDPMIEIRDLYKIYGQVQAVRGISFTVYRGEILGFLGPNGAGKSTTMKVMTGLTPPSAGDVKIAGHDVLDEPLEVRRAIGFLPEHPPLYTEMSVADYLGFAAEIRGIARARRKQAVDAAAERCGLTEVTRRLVGNLSKGYRQRVGLAQAVIHDPRILILDEPTVGLDPTQVIEIRSIVRDIGKERTVILSSHILPEVQATCQRVVIINRGKVVAEGALEDLLAAGGRGRLVVWLKRPPANTEDIVRVAGARGVETLAEGRFRVDLDAGEDSRERAIAGLAASAFGLLEARSETTTLEEVFKDVVLSEHHHAGGAA